MAQVRLSDVIIPDVWLSYGEVNSPELVAFLNSGIVATNPVLDEHANGPSKTGHIPYWNDLDATIEPDYTNDDATDRSSPQKIAADELSYRKAYMHQSWSAMDLVKQLAGADPMAQIKSRTSLYWLRQLQRRIIAITKGLLADSIANHASDMLIDVSSQDGNNATDANRFSATAFLNAVFTMGDAANRFVGMAMHSMVALQVSKNEDIDFIRDSEGKIIIGNYRGMIVVIDDSMPVTAGTTSGFRFTTALFGPGVIGMGVGTPNVPVEVWRDPQAGNGGGLDELHERKNWLLHPAGYDWVEAGGGALAEFSPTNADLAVAAKWSRKYARKQIPLAFLITN